MAQEPETPAPPQLRLLQLRDQINAAFDGMIEELDVFVEQMVTMTAAEHENAVKHAVGEALSQAQAAQQEEIARVREETAKLAADQVAAARVEIEAEAEAK